MFVLWPLKEPWGKLLLRHAPDSSDSPRLSQVAHCIDVAAVMQGLLALPTLQRRLRVLAGWDLTALDIERLCALTFLHDIGKANWGFYSKGVAPEVLRAWQLANPATRRTAPGRHGRPTLMVMCRRAGWSHWATPHDCFFRMRLHQVSRCRQLNRG